MARVIGEGLVKVRPSTRGFNDEAERELSAGMARVVARLERIAARLEPALARIGQRAGRQFTAGVDSGTGRLRRLLGRLFVGIGVAAFAAGIASAAAHTIALAAAVWQAVGALGALPGAAFAAAAGIGTAVIAFSGLGDALTATASRAGPAAGTLAAAERRIAAAQRDALAAQQAVTEARAEAADRIRELALDLQGAALAEERAALGVADAETRLAAARRGGDPTMIVRADLAYREAAHSLAEAQARTTELAEAQQSAAAAGVEGSQQVQAALQRQADAADALAAAQQAADNAMSGGGVDKQAEAMARLAPSARALVRTLQGLSDRWDGLRRRVQDRFFAGVAGDIERLAGRWLPMLDRRLVQTAGAWNTSIRAAAGLLNSRAYVADVDTALGHAATSTSLLGRATVTVISALRHIGVAGGPILDRLASAALRIARRFDAWAQAGRQSGRFTAAMHEGVSVLRQLGAIAGNVGGIIAAIFRGGGAEAGKDMLAGLESGTARLRAFLSSAEGQQKISAVLTTLRNIISSVARVLPQLLGHAEKLGPTLASAAAEGGPLSDTLNVTAAVMGFLADHVDTLTALLPYLAAGFLIVKTAQVAGNAAAAISPALTLASALANRRLAASNLRLAAAMRASTAATRTQAAATAADTVATTAGDTMRKRSIATMVAARAATIAGTVATKAATVGTWLLNAAQRAMPLILIVTLIIGLVAWLVHLYKTNETFRKIVQAVWQSVYGAIRFVIDWLVKTAWPWIQQFFQRWVAANKLVWTKAKEYFGKVIDFVRSIPARIRTGAARMWDGIVESAKGAVNKVLSIWNGIDIGVSVTIPSWIPKIGGKRFSIPDLFPDVPLLADGAILKARPGGTMFVGGEGGEDEAVVPLSRLEAFIRRAVAAAGRAMTIEKVEVKAFTDRFSLRQVQDELALHGAA